MLLFLDKNALKLSKVAHVAKQGDSEQNHVKSEVTGGHSNSSAVRWFDFCLFYVHS